MSTPYFPPLSNEALTPLRVVRELIKKNPALLDDPACPYDENVKKFLRDTFVAQKDEQKVPDIPEVDVGDLDDPDQLFAEFDKLYRNLQTFQVSINSLDPKDKVQWAKAAVSLLERIVSLKERTANIKSVSQFQKTVIGFLDEILEPAQRTTFTEKLGNYIHER